MKDNCTTCGNRHKTMGDWKCKALDALHEDGDVKKNTRILYWLAHTSWTRGFMGEGAADGCPAWTSIAPESLSARNLDG